jgi:hypothetical protein
VEQQIAPFQQRPWQKKKICVCLYSHACMYCEARMGCAALGQTQAMECGFGGVFLSFWLDEIFWCAKISQKMLNSQTCWA